METGLQAVVELLVQEDGQSAARICRRLGLARSELQRLLAVLGEDPAFGGLGWVELRDDDGRDRLWLTPAARTALAAT